VTALHPSGGSQPRWEQVVENASVAARHCSLLPDSAASRVRWESLRLCSSALSTFVAVFVTTSSRASSGDPSETQAAKVSHASTAAGDAFAVARRSCEGDGDGKPDDQERTRHGGNLAVPVTPEDGSQRGRVSGRSHPTTAAQNAFGGAQKSLR